MDFAADTVLVRTVERWVDVPSGEVDPILPGTPVCLQGAMIYRADATNEGRSFVMGLASRLTMMGEHLRMVVAGNLTLPTATWNALTGGSGGLTQGAIYYLGSTPGGLTLTAPVAPGSSLSAIGLAITSTTLAISRTSPIYL